MTVANLGAEKFAEALLALLPRGAAWPRDPDTVMRRALLGLAASVADQHSRTADLSEHESDPARTLELLALWERAYGLPDACVGERQGIEARRAALLARIASSGGQSRSYFVAVAAALGFTVTIEEFRPFRFGAGRFGDAMRGLPWLFTWRVRAPEQTTRAFRFGASGFGEPLRDWGNAPLECVLRRLAPAHTTVLFGYGG